MINLQSAAYSNALIQNVTFLTTQPKRTQGEMLWDYLRAKSTDR